MKLEVRLTLKSDATFGRGDGVAGLVDAEVEQDEYGLPFLRGRTLKGLLVEECANILFMLEETRHAALEQFTVAARLLFGRAGSTLVDDARMRVGDARLPKPLRIAVADEIRRGRLQPEDVLASLTAIRRQTAVDEETQAPERNSLRSLRVVLRGVELAATLDCDADVMNDDARALLAACVLALRRAGSGRNRGRGRLQARLYDEQGKETTDDDSKQDREVTDDWFALFAARVAAQPEGEQ